MQKTDSDVRVEKLQEQENISKGEEQTKDKEPESISKSLGVGVCYQRL